MVLLYVPTVETERLILRPINVEDTDDFYEICSDSRVVDYLTYPVHSSVEVTKETIEKFFLTNPANGIPEAYVLALKENGKMIGTCNFVNLIHGDTAEIGYQLNYDYWGKGYMSEALEKVIEVGFNQLGLRRIEIAHAITNTRSQKVIEKAGFVYEGTCRKYIYDKINKEFVDCRHYSILKDEWREKWEN